MRTFCGSATLLLLVSIGGLLLSLSGVTLANDETGENPTTLASSSNWALRLPEERAVTFRGIGSFDNVGLGSGQMMYPAPNAAGFLAAIITHAVIVNSAKNSQMSKVQEEADKVLVPYRTILDGLDSRDLMTKALAISANSASGKLVGSKEEAKNETIVESTPLFSMTPDQSAIIVDNLLAIQKPGDSPESAYRNNIRVVLHPGSAPDPIAFWTANNGEKLKSAATKLLAESIDIAFNDANASKNEEKPFRTIRYLEGSSEKIERAQIIESRCGRLLVKTLRGTLMSVPAGKSVTSISNGEACGEIAALGK